MKQSSAKHASASRNRPTREAGERHIEFGELPSYVGYQVRRTQAKIFGEFAAKLGEFDFTPGSFGVLTLIRANPGITQVELATAFGVDKSTMSPVIVRLARRGLVRREVLARDRRCQGLFFEAAREGVFLAARQKVAAFEASLAARLSKSEQRDLSRLLAKLHAGEGQR